MLRPTIVAESLVAVPDPLATVLRPGPVTSGAAVAQALALSLRPEEDPAAAPAWLLPPQVPAFRRVLAALRRYGGALLADPVGSGKTYIALAVASVLGRWPAACLVPAPLVAQWRATATRLGVQVVIGSHQQASRGRLPASDRGLVIIDESHHFRTSNTRRYQHVAPWLIGRPTLLLTATPVVNRLSDLAAQLLLGVRADALAPDGVPSFPALLADGRSSPALGRLVFERAEAGPRPVRHESTSIATAAEQNTASRLLAGLDRLRLSNHDPLAALLRGVFCTALASSPAALAGALRRYRTLLLHARDAAAAGRNVDRTAIRRFTGERPDQLVWWELMADAGVSDTGASDTGMPDAGMPDPDASASNASSDLASSHPVPIELALDDLAQLELAIGAAEQASRATDGKLERLQQLLLKPLPTLVFAARRETVRYLRNRLGRGIAWCTGDQAGLGPLRAPRETVWGWFGGAAPCAAPAHVLIATDVAAEGLDLRRVERVIHYDLPYTPMRLAQREGRAIRLGALHPMVEVVRFVPPRPVERRLGQLATLARKARLPAIVGLGSEGRECWRWRAELAERYSAPAAAMDRTGTATAGADMANAANATNAADSRSTAARPASPAHSATGSVASVSAHPPGILAGYRIDGVVSSILWYDHAMDTWTDDPATVSARLAQAAASAAVRPPSSAAVRDALLRLAEPLRLRLATTVGRRWTLPDPAPAARELAARLRLQAVAAARRRDGAALRRLERALQVLAGGHTAGEAIAIANMEALPDAELAAAVGRLPARPPLGLSATVCLTGLVLFEPV